MSHRLAEWDYYSPSSTRSMLNMQAVSLNYFQIIIVCKIFISFTLYWKVLFKKSSFDENSMENPWVMELTR